MGRKTQGTATGGRKAATGGSAPAPEYLVLARGQIVWRTTRYADAVAFRWGWGEHEASIARVLVGVSTKVSTKRATPATHPANPRAKTPEKKRGVEKRASTKNRR